jgi:23S rRNA (uracil1939-C5)-methyltransferase
MPEIPFQISDLVEVKVEKMAYGESGIARSSGVVIFVPFSAPGDVLRVRITQIKKNFVEGEIVEIISPGPSRVAPPCPVYGNCGGCDWQHLSYQEQLKQKSEIVHDFLKKSGKAGFNYLGIVGSPLDFRYRNRVQLKADGKKVGFFSRKSHQVVGIDDCLLVEEKISSEIKKLADTYKKSAEKIEIFIDQDEKCQTKIEDSGDSAEGFSQVNRTQNDILIDSVVQWAADKKFQNFYDLYAGSGNFSFPVVENFSGARVVAVELNEKSVELAHKKLSEKKISLHRCQFFLGDVELFLKRTQIHENSVILLDPPRAGCSQNVINYLNNSKASRIYYISCNPAALSRDLSLFGNAWKLRRVQAFDMFPQTHHVEVLAELSVDS